MSRRSDITRAALGADDGRPAQSSLLSRLARALGIVLMIVLGICGGVLATFRVSAALRETDRAEAIAPPAGRFVETRSGRVFLLDEGPREGPPVLLIHGTAAWSEFWRGTIEHLVAQRYRVVAIDLPPFGFSDRAPDGDYSRETQALRIAGVLDALGIERAILVGHSFGAGATVETVMRYPRRVNGLVLVAGALGLPERNQANPDPPAAIATFLSLPVLPDLLVAATATNPMLTQRMLAGMVARKEAATPELVEVLRRPMMRTGTTSGFVVWARAFVAADDTAQSVRPHAYQTIRAPTRLIWGDLDTITPLEQGERIAGLIGNARLELMRGVGHIPQIEAPARFRALLTRLLGEIK
jgi:pimeloyl-ACP methyl ester carboxylesterase